MSAPQGHSATERIMSIKHSDDTIGHRTCDFPVCSAVQPIGPKITKQCIQKVKEQCNLTVFNGDLATTIRWVGRGNVCLILSFPQPKLFQHCDNFLNCTSTSIDCYYCIRLLGTSQKNTPNRSTKDSVTMGLIV
jgi:hypothetical protein